MTAVCLLLLGAHSTFDFDGTPVHFNRFFSDIDLVYDMAGVAPTDKEHIW